MGGRATEMVQHLGRMEKAWAAVKKVADDAWRSMVNFVNGSQVDPRVEQLEKLEAQLAARQKQAPVVGNDAAWQQGNKKLTGQISALKQALQIDKELRCRPVCIFRNSA